jgi:hypothetical protein
VGGVGSVVVVVVDAPGVGEHLGIEEALEVLAVRCSSRRRPLNDESWSAT